MGPEDPEPPLLPVPPPPPEPPLPGPPGEGGAEEVDAFWVEEQPAKNTRTNKTRMLDEKESQPGFRDIRTPKDLNPQ